MYLWVLDSNLYVHRAVCARSLQAAFQQWSNHWRNSEWAAIAQAAFSLGHSVVVWLTATQASQEGYGPESLQRYSIFLDKCWVEICKVGFVVWSSASLGLGRSNKHYWSEDLKVELDTGFKGEMFSLLPQALSCTEMEVWQLQ